MDKKPFDNKERHRYYGVRVGDTVKLLFSNQNPEPIAEVVEYGFLDNNRVVVQLEDGTMKGWVAEWCEIITKVEDKDPKTL
ncbi:MAG: hypothetical protein PHT07_23980 [Paludibacter sp.]|nr:hypothetical protein [Paludibacter sp.]